MLTALEDVGFSVEVVMEEFRVEFAGALNLLRRAWMPGWVEIVPADLVDEERLFELDNDVRRDVPGTDGWTGNRSWFHEELAESPPFDRGAYLVAVDRRDGTAAGLVRIWRNAGGPRFGLVGTRRPYRRTTIAAALLRRSLLAASTWGFDSFTSVASPSNPVTYPRLVRIASERLGSSRQMVRR